MSNMDPFTVVDIRDAPEHARSIAAWVHHAWWANTDTTVDDISRWVSACTTSGGFPGILIAVAERTAIGSVFLHRTEAEDRPLFTPYLGALYVEPSWRGRSVGRTLVRG